MQAITALNMDKTPLLADLVQKQWKSWKALLAELQYAFIGFLCCYSLDCFGQWKALVQLLAACEGVAEWSALYSAYLPLLAAQLQAAPADLFTAAVSAHSFITHALRNLFALAEDAPPLLQPHFRHLELAVQRHFDDFNPHWEDDEYAPTIVYDA